MSVPAAAVVLAARLLAPVGDLDGDGLNDAAEAELAEAFRPKLVFSVHENALRPGEPVTLYQVRPIKDKPLTLRLVFMNLWEEDGGYGPNSFFCGDKHKGDNQSVTMKAVSYDNGATFYAAEVGNGAYTWPTKSGAARWEGTHPVIYFSAGKHHQFFDAANDDKPSPYSQWACRETLDAGGARFLTALRANAGEPERHPSPPFAGDLAPYGFPGENAWSDKPFRGPKVSPTASSWSREPRVP